VLKLNQEVHDDEYTNSINTERSCCLISGAHSVRSTLANWRNQKRGPKFYMVGRKPIYRPEDIEAFLFQNPVLTIDSVEVNP